MTTTPSARASSTVITRVSPTAILSDNTSVIARRETIVPQRRRMQKQSQKTKESATSVSASTVTTNTKAKPFTTLDYYDTKKSFISRKEVRQSLKAIFTRVHASVTFRSAARLDPIRANQLQEFILKAYSDDELKVLQEIRYEILQHLDRSIKSQRVITTNSRSNDVQGNECDLECDNIFDFFVDRMDDFVEYKSDGRIPSDYMTCKDLFCLFQKEFCINTKRMFETKIRQRVLDTLESMGRKKRIKDNDNDIVEINITDIINLVFSHAMNSL
jgi:hypothetical protein